MNKHKDSLNYDVRKFNAWIGTTAHLDDQTFEFRRNEHSSRIRSSKLTERIPVNEYNRMLVIGCGNGGELKAIEDLGYDATGISLCDEEAFNEAAKHCKDLRTMDMA